MDKYARTAQTFDRHASAYAEKFSRHRPYLETYQRFCELIGAEKPAVLDAACGPGIFSRFVLDRFPESALLGVDLAPRMLELARLKNPEARFECLDVRRIVELKERFDVVLFAFCFPYLTEQDVLTLIRKLPGILNRNSWLYISLIEGSPAASGMQRNKEGDQVYQCYHSPALIRNALADSGFEIISEMRQELTEADRAPEQEWFAYARRET